VKESLLSVTECTGG